MGQAFNYANCGACDICLGHFQRCENSSDIILKILSAIKRTGENYSLKVINDILLGIKPKTATSSDFRALSTFGILRDQTSFQVEDWIEQIVSLGLIRFRDPTTILQITSVGNEILRGKRASPFLLDRFQKPSPTQLSQWSPAASVDRELFQITENWLHSQVDRETPLCPSLAWQIARVKPRSIEQLASVAQCHPDTIRDTCSGLLAVINEYCRKRNLQSEMQLDQRYFASLATEIHPERTGLIKTANNAALRHFPAFEAGTSIEEIATQYGVKPGTIFDYLCVFIEERRLTDCTTWISASTISRIEATIDLVGMERYRPIFEQLHEEVSYGEIKAVCAARKVRMEHVTLLLESEYNAEGI
jgi:ATP-dependent DNA helicase RecQ